MFTKWPGHYPFTYLVPLIPPNVGGKDFREREEGATASVRDSARFLQVMSDELYLGLHVHHFGQDGNKWIRIELRLFSFIIQNWRSRLPASHQTAANLIPDTTTRTGSIVKAALDSHRNS
jgi:hypothetical protein